MKMLMILSSDRSNHTTICVQWETGEEGETYQYHLEELKNTQRSDTWRNLCPSVLLDLKDACLYNSTPAQRGSDGRNRRTSSLKFVTLASENF